MPSVSGRNVVRAPKFSSRRVDYQISGCLRQYTAPLTKINETFDVLNRLPFELQCLIFRNYCGSPANGIQQQITLLSVCRSWRDVALAIPHIWTTFYVPRASNQTLCVILLRRWFKSSKYKPIRIVFGSRTDDRNPTLLRDFMSSVGAVIMQNRNRVHSLQVDAGVMAELLAPDMLLADSKGRDWVSISHISMTGLYFWHALAVLRICPNLTSVDFQSINGFFPMSNPTVEARFLEKMKVNFSSVTGSESFLASLKTPALQELRCSANYCSISHYAILSLLRRSSCSLQILHIALTRFYAFNLLSLLQEQRALRHLSITLRVPDPGWPWEHELGRYETVMAFDSLFQRLCNTHGQEILLPHLETLEYTGRMRYSWETLVQVYYSHVQDHVESSDELPYSTNGPPTISYRPLRLIKVAILDSTDTIEKHDERRASVNKLKPEAQKCSFEYSYEKDIYLANMNV